MKFNMTKMAAGLVLAGFAVAANAATVTSMTITSGTFAMDDPLDINAFTYINANTNLVGGYIGTSLNSVTATALNAGDIVSFSFFNKPVHTYTALTNLGDTNTAAGTQTGGPVPTGDITGATMTMDMSSWFANWNISDFNMPGTATGSVVSGWRNTAMTFPGLVPLWVVRSTFHRLLDVAGHAVAAVPEASTYGMMLAGLGLVGFAVRRRKLMA